ncbi:MAG: M18 family aminopeptidase [Ruminococcaceae bacterium]|nr:M18 family aminopeptidase [Oscillospiraceae bacterium]
MDTNKRLFEYIATSPTAYHAVAHTAALLEVEGYTELEENKKWELQRGKGYFVTRNGSSLIAFRVPRDDYRGFMMTAAHCDSPSFKIKENAVLSDGKYTRLSVEKYGGMLCSTWLDRPLSIAGRVMVRTQGGIETRLIDFGEPCALIPNVAIHMNRNANDGMAYNAAVDMLPLIGEDKKEGASFIERVAALADAKAEDIITTDLFLYAPDEGVEWNGFISAPRIDDLQCAFASLKAFVDSGNGDSMPVYCLFDNEEVGSRTKQGAASTFLFDVLMRTVSALGGSDEDYRCKVASSFLVSCDNGHAVHPNHPEYADKNHSVLMNGGVVIKYNANQQYTTDALSSAVFRLVCEEAGVPVQSYANRADMPGGSTLGNIANTQVSLNTVDIGLAQLAMHSAFETAGADDTEHLIKALTLFFGKSLCTEQSGVYKLI